MSSTSKRGKSFFNKKSYEPPNFLRNGGALMEKLISLSNGRDDIHIKRYTKKQIIKATSDLTSFDGTCEHYTFFRGILDGRWVLVVFQDKWSQHHAVVLPTAISALMSRLKYVLKLIGCCLDFECPVLVYVYPGRTMLSNFLAENPDVTLSWGHRIKIARDIASMVVYLHTSFPVSIIHRNLKPTNVFIDQNGDAKLFNFNLAVEIPRGESEVTIRSTYRFMAPEYYRTATVTTKTDVYAFGVILFMLLTGNLNQVWSSGWKMPINRSIEQFIDVDEQVIDPKISQEVGMDEFQSIKYLALSCLEERADNRPEMIDVARRLYEIEKKINKASSRIVSSLEDSQNSPRNGP